MPLYNALRLRRKRLLGIESQPLARAGFVPDPGVPITEYNRRPAAVAAVVGPPVIYEAAFRFD